MPLFVIIIMAGCGDPKVTGKVTFPDGSPLTKGQVMFQAPNFVGSGDIRKDGTYSAGKLKDGDGLPLGHYQVFISGTLVYDQSQSEPSQEAAIGRMPVSRTPKPINLIASKFTSPGSSGLTVEVKGNTKFDITVDPPQ